MPPSQLVDRFGRKHTKLRISVTDRCNLRCHYCMPAEGIPVAARHDLLTYEEIEAIVRIAADLGVWQIRLTGGEPLVRQDLPELVSRIAANKEIKDLALTTNAILLDQYAKPLYESGLRRLNISLDALDPVKFAEITRRDQYDKVIAGIEAAQSAGFDAIKINVVSLRGVTDSEIIPFGNFARETGLEVRFIEYMPLDASKAWERDKVLFAEEIQAVLSDAIQPLVPTTTPTSSPATEYEFADGVGRIGFIPTVSQPFCASCDRFRLTADGKLRNCLFSLEETDLRDLMRSSLSGQELDSAIAAQMKDSIASKGPGHQINTSQFVQPDRTMSAIGG